ncbi:ComF family protein [Aerococcaceae bacterium NML191292]|nr:ComF family protein [Aerococcaceae bacterium NML191292]MCW6666481.1 ComF family protein [Aerococcaceae bacterium NML190938]
MNCLLCGEQTLYDLHWQDIWQWRQIEADCLCKKCRATFCQYPYETNGCSGCGRLLDGQEVFTTAYYVENMAYCYDCHRWLEQYPSCLVKHTALLVYNESVREWLYQYKYRADARLAQAVAPYLCAFYREHSNCTWIVLPSSPKSIEERGFHATGYLLDRAEIPYICPFEYIGDGRKQARKNRQERLALEQPFALCADKLALASSTQWLIFDDVYTTGATLLKAKELLYACVPDKTQVSSVSLARDTLQ